MSRRPLPPVEGADVPNPDAIVLPGALPLADQGETPAADQAPAVLVDRIGGPAATPPAAQGETPAAESGEPATEQDTTTKTGKGTGAAKSAAQTRKTAARKPTTRKAPAGRQRAAQGRTEAAPSAATPGSNGTEAEATPTAPAPPPPTYAGYVERGAPVPFTPPPAAAVPKRLLANARAVGMQWVSVNMRALKVRAEYDQACDEARALCRTLGLDAAAVEAALLDMGNAIGAPVAAPLDAGAPADA